MNQNIYKLISFLFLSVFLFVPAGCKNAGPVYQVNDVVSDPDAYIGTLTVEGVVYTFSTQDQSIIGIMDKKELQCTTPNCKKNLLPMQFAGSRLSVGDEVKVSGSLVKGNRGYLLTAKDVKVVATHKLGG